MTPGENDTSAILADTRVVFVGKLASMSRRDATALARRHGAVVVDKPNTSVQLAVLGEESPPTTEGDALEEWFDEATRGAIEAGALRLVTETQFWQQLGLIDAQQNIHRLYTPAMLAELLGVSVAIIRRWHRRGLIVPAREVRRLPYFDFQEVATARRLAELLAAGASPEAIERKLETLGRYLPGVKRPLAQLSVIVEGKEILLRGGDGLIEPGGQLRFDFDASGASSADIAADETGTMSIESDALLCADEGDGTVPLSGEEMSRLAIQLEEEGRLTAAAEMYRAAMAAAGPSAELCFQVGELLYRQGDLAGSRERYYMAVELDENYVEARANLGCVLAEMGQSDLAVAAFEGALVYHSDYADVHYHLAKTLDEIGQMERAVAHWREFVDLAPTSPWAEEARSRIGRADG